MSDLTIPTMQVAVIETRIEDERMRTATIRLCMWYGESSAKFSDLPPDMQVVLKRWVLGHE